MILLAAFLIPLAIYCLILAAVNRRSHPVMVPGAWDFAGMLFGASGFLLVVGPAVLSSLNERWRYFWLLGHSPNSPTLEEGSRLWVLAGVLYFVAVTSACGLTLLSRRYTTAIYNISPSVLDGVLADVLDGLGRTWARAGDQVFIGSPGRPLDGRQTAASEAIQEKRPAEVIGRRELDLPIPAASSEQTSAPLPPEEGVMLRVEPFRVMSHVTLLWQPGDEDTRQEVEASLQRALRQVYVRHNPVGGWLLGLGSSLLCLSFLGLLFLLAYQMFRR